MNSQKIAVDNNIYYVKFGDNDTNDMRNNKNIYQQLFDILEKIDSMNIMMREHIKEVNLPELKSRLESIEKKTLEAKELATKATETQDKRRNIISSFFKLTPLWITATIGLYIIFIG